MLTERSVKPLLETDGGKGEDMKGYKEHEMIVVRISKEEQKFLFTRREKALKKYERSLIWKKRWRRFLQKNYPIKQRICGAIMVLGGIAIQFTVNDGEMAFSGFVIALLGAAMMFAKEKIYMA